MSRIIITKELKKILPLSPDTLSEKGGKKAFAPPPHKSRAFRKKALLGLRRRFSERRPYPHTPILPPPEKEEGDSIPLPPRYFSRGAIDRKDGKNPTPIPYLLSAQEEYTKARQAPTRAQLLRSLCKGKGRLKKSDMGGMYLDIDDRFILAMLPFVEVHGLQKPPYFNLFSAPKGAHIAVITPREAYFHFLEEFLEVEKEFSFTIEGLYSLTPSLWPEVEEVWFFKARAEGLEALRRRYFLPPLPNGNFFHITVAIKPKSSLKPISSLPKMRINPAFFAA